MFYDPIQTFLEPVWVTKSLLCFLKAQSSAIIGMLSYAWHTPVIVFAVKMTACLLFLIFIRGGVPRYRYDFLTKIGWLKFLGYVFVVFISIIASCILF